MFHITIVTYFTNSINILLAALIKILIFSSVVKVSNRIIYSFFVKRQI